VGDGSVFDPMPSQQPTLKQVWSDYGRIHAAYAQSIAYSMSQLVSFVEHERDDDLVVVALGDHQPASVVSGQGASRDVPVTIVAKDPAVLAGITGWGWNAGLAPASNAPVWPMSAFRDRFLGAFAAPAASRRTSRPKDQARAASAAATAGTTTARGRTSATATARTIP
jgi:hypothetical protein